MEDLEESYIGLTEALFRNLPEAFQENMKSLRIADASEEFCSNESPEHYVNHTLQYVNYISVFTIQNGKYFSVY
jgi:hypothetical protein